MALRTQTRSFEGQAGPIDCILDWPDGTPQGWALVLHPHPLHGGSSNNKIVTTIARACVQRGLLAVRPNFRGVGASAGAFDAARGETADMLGLAEQFAAAYPAEAAGKWVLAGFSFGTSVAAQFYSARADAEQPVPDALLLFGSAVERFRFRDVRVPAHTMLVHGEADEVVPLDEAMSFAREHDLPMVVVPDASHFFHGKLIILKNLLQQRLQAL
ncbi:alpha/beta hydrolase [Pusillimonas sp. TS35]|uniref:alpha/beta hydrolase n=1 Tax=Paracandidimonas lactea TaxID=2895524 RepID=UPI00136D782C|nr:alpha/beta hydrolase [Paracandidimonas lactea]MYN13978.1 alpha/beta hydrolase [Pusillimonas sp. TS35]